MLEQYKPALKQGVFLGSLGIVINVVTYAVNPELFLDSSFDFFMGLLFGVAAPIVFMILGARNSKINFNEFNFYKAFSSAFIVGITAVFLLVVYSLIFNNFIDTELADWIYETKMEEQLNKLEDAGYDDAQIEQTMEMADSIKKYTTGNIGTVLMNGLTLLWYAVIALIIALVQRDKEPKDTLVIE